MILVLKNNIKIEIFRQTCGYMYKGSKLVDWDNQTGFVEDNTIEWNIDPIEHLQKQSSGFFVVTNIGNQNIKTIVPVRNVSHIESPNEWEYSTSVLYKFQKGIQK